MNQQLINDWLGLSGENGSPNYYALLGLPSGESDLKRIEQQVHERLEKVRCYQLSHPDEATEAMNRLAQALVCLSNPETKKAYDAGLRTKDAARPLSASAEGKAIAPPAVRAALPPGNAMARKRSSSSGTGTVLDLDTATIPPTPLPPAVAVSPVETPSQPADGPSGHAAAPKPSAPAVATALLTQSAQANGQGAAPKPAAPAADDDPDTPILESAPADPVFETARSSPAAKRGLGTKRALYHRIAHTRQLLWAWEQAGKYLNRPRRQLTRAAEETDLVRRLTDVRDLLEDFPALLGRPGQPGQFVSAIVRQQLVAQTFKLLDLNQREALAKDWLAGRTLLLFHRQFLRQELRSLRKRTWWGRTVRAVRATLNDHPGYVLLAIGALALLIALFHWVND